MIFSKKFLALTAALALSFAAAACDDDASSSDDKGTETGGSTGGTTGGGEVTTTDCDGGATKAGTYKCDGSNLAICVNGSWNLAAKCEGATPICNASKNMCEADPDAVKGPECVAADFKDECYSGTSIRKCTAEGNYKIENCGANQKCAVNADTGASCVDDIVEVKSSVVGGACSCEGNDCNIIITGKELKASIDTSNSLLTMAKIVGVDAAAIMGNIKDDEQIVAPNYFSSSIKGCEELAKVVPDGMSVGCFRDSTITFPEGLITAITELGSKLGKLATIIPALKDLDLTGVITKMSGLLSDGITFTSPNGYCLAAAIDIELQVTNSMITGIVKMDNVNKIIDKINTGDHSKAKTAECPEGSTLLSYTVNSATEGQGSADVGFDVCLKACETDDDCRKSEGYSCVELPNGVPAEGQTTEDLPTKKVCFDAKNIEYFEGMTEQFDTLLPSKD